MKIAIVGNGIVGKATQEVIRKEHEICIHDPKQGLECDFRGCDAVFICTPTDCVQEYLNQLTYHSYVFIRSTIPFNIVQGTDFAVWPEFLTERTWRADATNPVALVCGGNDDQLQMLKEITMFDDYASRHDFKWHHTQNDVAAFMKNATNTFYAMKVTFANMLFETCNRNSMSYNMLKDCIKHDPRMGDMHWQVPGPDGKQGYGGNCFPDNLDIMLGQVDWIGKRLLNSVQEFNSIIREEE